MDPMGPMDPVNVDRVNRANPINPLHIADPVNPINPVDAANPINPVDPVQCACLGDEEGLQLNFPPSVSSDGRLLFWDVRNMSAVVDECELTDGGKDTAKTLGGVSLDMLSL